MKSLIGTVIVDLARCARRAGGKISFRKREDARINVRRDMPGAFQTFERCAFVPRDGRLF